LIAARDTGFGSRRIDLALDHAELGLPRWDPGKAPLVTRAIQTISWLAPAEW